MARLGRPDEIIVRDLELFPEVPEADDDLVGELDGRQAARGGRFLHLLAVLVRPGQEEDVIARRPLEAGQGVGDDRCVGVADVGNVVDVIDRRRYVKGLLRILFH